MQLLKQGAEASLFLTEYFGEKVIVKQREQKKYREKKLDEKILKERIRTECNLILKAQKAGVRTPLIKEIGLEQKSITFEYITGKTLKETLIEEKEIAKFCKEAGKEIAKLHSNKIIHGDLTTSNIIIHNNKLVFLDFSLGNISSKIEDFAVDLLVFKKTFKATHYNIIEFWKKIEESYSKEFSDGKEVLKKIEKVESRARYF